MEGRKGNVTHIIDFKPAGRTLPNQNRLEDAVLADGRGKLGQGLGIHAGPRLHAPRM